MQVSRRQFFKICAGGMAGTTAAALGFAPGVALAETRQYKLLRTRETRNTCTYWPWRAVPERGRSGGLYPL